MKLSYKKSRVYPDYYIIICNEQLPILDFISVNLKLHISTTDYIVIMKLYNGVLINKNGMPCHNYRYDIIDYMFFPTELDVQNAIEHLNSIVVLEKLSLSGN